MSGLHMNIYTPPSGPRARARCKSLFFLEKLIINNIYYTMADFWGFLPVSSPIVAVFLLARARALALIIPTKLVPLKTHSLLGGGRIIQHYRTITG